MIVTFFQDAIWVLGFFYLLTKIFNNAKLKHFSKYAIVIILVMIFIRTVLNIDL